MRSATLSGPTYFCRADDWIGASMMRFAGPSPFSIEPRRQLKQEYKDSNPVTRLWRPLPLPGGHSCVGPRPCGQGPLGVTTLLSQRHVPVRFADELRPAFDSHLVVRVQRLP